MRMCRQGRVPDRRYASSRYLAFVEPHGSRAEHCFESGPQRGMERRCVHRRMIARDLVDLLLRFGFGIHLRVGPADDPENVRHAPCTAEYAEVLAGGGRLRLESAVAEPLFEGLADTARCMFVVDGQRIAA